MLKYFNSCWSTILLHNTIIYLHWWGYRATQELLWFVDLVEFFDRLPNICHLHWQFWPQLLRGDLSSFQIDLWAMSSARINRKKNHLKLFDAMVHNLPLSSSSSKLRCNNGKTQHFLRKEKNPRFSRIQNIDYRVIKPRPPESTHLQYSQQQKH